MYVHVFRPLLFALSKDDPEEAHLIIKKLARSIGRLRPLIALIDYLYDPRQYRRSAQVCGIIFPNRVGLAAGFDKDAEMVLLMQALGFGFLEIGSVLPYAQEGNSRPRMFRIPEQEALINRMGFNSAGADVVARNLDNIKHRIKIPIGINAGKMFATPLDDAGDDYLRVFALLRHLADYLAINVNSPNTKDLRKLQGKEFLVDLIKKVVEQERKAAEAKGEKTKPVAVKIAPDLTEAETVETVGACLDGGARILIVSNTTTSRPPSVSDSPFAQEKGGLSGRPVFDLALEKVRLVRRHCDLPIIAVGGIDCFKRATQMRDVGADLIQILTSLVYKGPQIVTPLTSLK